MKVFLILLLLQACVQIAPSKKNVISEDSFVNQFQQCQNGVLAKDDLVSKIHTLNLNSQQLFSKLSPNDQAVISNVRVTVIEQHLNPTDPLVMNREYFLRKYNQILTVGNTLDEDIWKFIYDGVETDISNILFDEAKQMAFVIKSSLVLDQLAQRWMQMHCNKKLLEQNLEDDLRLNSAFNSDQYKNYLSKSEFFDYFFFTFGKEVFNKFFSLKIANSTRKFSCVLSTQNETVMNIPVMTDKYFDQIKAAVEERWSKPGFFRINLIQGTTSSPNLVTISIRKHLISHTLKVAGNEIFLNPMIFDNFSENSKRTIAHEFGHVLGFPDCYLEFFDKKDNLVNYYLTPNNLMCSIDGDVPNHYYLQMQEHLCF